MKVSVVPWHVFWQACDNQEPAPAERWLQRWAFGDRGVGPLVKSQSRHRESSGHPVHTADQAELKLPFSATRLYNSTARSGMATPRVGREAGKRGLVLYFNPN